MKADEFITCLEAEALTAGVVKITAFKMLYLTRVFPVVTSTYPIHEGHCFSLSHWFDKRGLKTMLENELVAQVTKGIGA